MTEVAHTPRLARFESFEVDLRTGELHKNGEKVKLPEQSFQVLAMLLARPGEVVMRKEIQKKLWPNDTVVEFENSINAAVKNLRLALRDSADQPRYVETLARRGYRWMVPVQWIKDDPIRPAELAGETPQPPPPATAYLLGKKVSHYRVLEILGGGGMGVVYKAEDIKLGRRVALKFLPEEMASDPAAMERFKREARAASALNHPNICTIYSVEEHNGQPFIAMELLEGQTLRELIGAAESSAGTKAHKEPLPLNQLLDIAIQIAEGLDAAHQKGIIHRDIKPANVFITTQARAKVLDFGLAKSQEFEGPDFVLSRAEAQPVANLYLTRIGTTIGTAGYMSPEQVRGEKVDSRTDLFSFGLVLYEMAVGHRAFPGETIPVLHAAILNDTATPVRELNPSIPAELESIINKALEKEREKRWQTASEICDSLRAAADRLTGKTTSHRVRWLIAAACVLAVVATVSAIWWAKNHRSGLPAVRETILTVNSAENPVGDGVISPDGKYFAYTDSKGMHLKVLATDEIRDLPLPEIHKDKPVHWGLTAWFPDSTRLVLNTHPGGVLPEEVSSQDTNAWTLSLLGGSPRLIRENAAPGDVSPDGSAIAFGANPGRFGDREIWLMDPDGNNARKLWETDEHSAINSVRWSPNGKFIAYWKVDSEGATLITRDLKGGPPTVIFSPFVGNTIFDNVWVPGRLIYSSSKGWCTFYEQAMDEESGRAVGSRRALTNPSLTSYCMSAESATADGKKLAFQKWQSNISVYLGDLDSSGTRVLKSRHFTLTRSHDDAGPWTPDGKALIVISMRSSDHGLYKQMLDENDAQFLPGTSDTRNQEVTPDGKWVLYFKHVEMPAAPEWPFKPETIMRASIESGFPQPVLTTTGAKNEISCARPPSGLCVVAEWSEDKKQVIVHALDPLKGRGAELTRFDVEPDDDRWVIALSPDGNRLAGIRRPKDPLYVWPVNGKSKEAREIRINGWSNLRAVRWSADSKNLLVLSHQKGHGTLLHTDLQGHANVLWEHVTDLWSESPDGRHLAVTVVDVDKNYWAMENF